MLKLIFKMFGIMMLGAVATGANRSKSRDAWPAGATDSDMANVPAQRTGEHPTLLGLSPGGTGEFGPADMPVSNGAPYVPNSDVPVGGHVDYPADRAYSGPAWATDTRPVRTDPALIPTLVLRASVDVPGRPSYAISAEGTPDFLRALSGAFLSTVTQLEAERH